MLFGTGFQVAREGRSKKPPCVMNAWQIELNVLLCLPRLLC